MGILTSTIKFKGSIGNELTAYELNGQTVIRKKCVERYRSNTYQQREYRNKFKVVNNFLRGMGDYFRLSFAEMFAMKRNTYSLAVKYNLACAVKGEGSEHYIDYSAAVLGDGPITPIKKARFDIKKDEIIVEWDDNSGEGSALADDWVLPVIFDKTLNLWVDNSPMVNRALFGGNIYSTFHDSSSVGLRLIRNRITFIFNLRQSIFNRFIDLNFKNINHIGSVHHNICTTSN